ncbi:uncharacterized protein LAJ45_10134 [Morchella importuna]|uniref:uncharacterized protein n=1 Tax=Morchella importuna TaxID=1174673 RepID=UPI001E8E0889|nr:uncharacterized protein LAJ45_10134 [Morchella importuna]KAH8145811.1 hypothetical protein LAJ45_10134 [Morchella importuna]
MQSRSGLNFLFLSFVFFFFPRARRKVWQTTPQVNLLQQPIGGVSGVHKHRKQNTHTRGPAPRFSVIDYSQKAGCPEEGSEVSAFDCRTNGRGCPECINIKNKNTHARSRDNRGKGGYACCHGARRRRTNEDTGRLEEMKTNLLTHLDHVSIEGSAPPTLPGPKNKTLPLRRGKASSTDPYPRAGVTVGGGRCSKSLVTCDNGVLRYGTATRRERANSFYPDHHIPIVVANSSQNWIYKDARRTAGEIIYLPLPARVVVKNDDRFIDLSCLIEKGRETEVVDNPGNPPVCTSKQ